MTSLFPKGFQSTWAHLLNLGIWIAIVIGAFVVPPPYPDYQTADVSGMEHFGRFMVSVLIGLLLFPMTWWSGRRYVWQWFSATVICLCLAVGIYFKYIDIEHSWTCPFVKRRVIVGETYTDDAIKYINTTNAARNDPTKRSLSCEDLLNANHGDASGIWDKEEIHQRYLNLSRVFVLSLCLFATTMMLLFHSLMCLRGAPERNAKIRKDTA